VETRRKIFFKLTQDENGYPPFAVESIWAKKCDWRDGYEIDNIPFFEREATLGDIVAVQEREGVLWFGRLLQPSSNSLIRIHVFTDDLIPRIRDGLVALGCSTEGHERNNFTAASVPLTTRMEEVRAFLALAVGNELLDYEEAILRH
jgi:hypothetical protein